MNMTLPVPPPRSHAGIRGACLAAHDPGRPCLRAAVTVHGEHESAFMPVPMDRAGAARKPGGRKGLYSPYGFQAENVGHPDRETPPSGRPRGAPPGA
jgi:hypothetical protein